MAVFNDNDHFVFQVGLLLTILLGHGVIDKLTLRHSRLAQVAQLKEILQICSNPVEETTEAMDTQESVAEVKSERSCEEGHVSNVAGEMKGERSYVRSHTEFHTRTDSSDNLPMKIAKTEMVAMGGQRSSLNKPFVEGMHAGKRQSESASTAKQSLGFHGNQGESSSDSVHSKPEEDLFDYCFTEPIKTHDSSGVGSFKCPSKRQPHFGVHIPKKKYDMRSANDRTRANSASVSAGIECQLCRALQYKVSHNVRAITHVVLLGFTLDVRDCVAIGQVLAEWMVLKRIELVDNCK